VSSEEGSERTFAELFSARRDLLALLEQLDPGDWDKPTLCEGWHVRDVAAHVASGPDFTWRTALPRLVRARGDVDRLIDEGAREAGQREPAEILEHLRANAESRHIPPKSTPGLMLADAVIHTLDICHPNGWDAEFPADRAKLVLSRVAKSGKPFGGKARAVGLHLDTTDIDWRCGCGDHVRGTAAVMLLALAGRSVYDQLKGDGVSAFADRA